MDDARVDRICRALRRRRGCTQAELAARAGWQQTAISRIVRGHVAGLRLAVARKVFAALDASFDGTVGWRAGELDRLLDERHAATVEAVAVILRRLDWLVIPEASYSEWGERGSIDILAGRKACRRLPYSRSRPRSRASRKRFASTIRRRASPSADSRASVWAGCPRLSDGSSWYPKTPRSAVSSRAMKQHSPRHIPFAVVRSGGGWRLLEMASQGSGSCHPSLVELGVKRAAAPGGCDTQSQGPAERKNARNSARSGALRCVAASASFCFLTTKPHGPR